MIHEDVDPWDLRAEEVDDYGDELVSASGASCVESDGGSVLFAWLMDEAHARGWDLLQLGFELSVTDDFLRQLKREGASCQALTRRFFSACAQLLAVPPIVVKLALGVVTSDDFARPQESAEDMLDRAMRTMMRDSSVRESLPMDLIGLPYPVKLALATMYADATDRDVFRIGELPQRLERLRQMAQKVEELTGILQKGRAAAATR